MYPEIGTAQSSLVESHGRIMRARRADVKCWRVFGFFVALCYAAEAAQEKNARILHSRDLFEALFHSFRG
jgi:hypothetical protein